MSFTVIPDFLAIKISKHVDMTGGEIEEQQFSKLVDVVHHYQDVSILFADIKGFTGELREHVYCLTMCDRVGTVSMLKNKYLKRKL